MPYSMNLYFPKTPFATIAIIFLAIVVNWQDSANAKETSSPLHVMTFNIRNGKAMDGLDAWPLRKHRTINLLTKYKPDVIGLQESFLFQLADIQKSMPGYQFVGTGRTDGRQGGEFSAIMYNTTRLNLLRSDTFWLSDTPGKPGTTTWGNKIVRICTWAYFQDRETGKFFYHFNTHLDHISQPSREKSAELILKRIDRIKPKDAVIITGDFNSGEKNPVVAEMKQGQFLDTYRAIHPDEKVVGTTTAFSPKRQREKIDYIFVDKSWTITDSHILTDKFDGRWPSDHLPVTATINLK